MAANAKTNETELFDQTRVHNQNLSGGLSSRYSHIFGASNPNDPSLINISNNEMKAKEININRRKSILSGSHKPFESEHWKRKMSVGSSLQKPFSFPIPPVPALPKANVSNNADKTTSLSLNPSQNAAILPQATSSPEAVKLDIHLI